MSKSSADLSKIRPGLARVFTFIYESQLTGIDLQAYAPKFKSLCLREKWRFKNFTGIAKERENYKKA